MNKFFSIALCLFCLSVEGAEFPRDLESCERFLKAYLPFDEARRVRIPLQNGTIGELNETFLGLPDVQIYLRANPHSPWQKELSLLTERHFSGSRMIFLSETGPTLWHIDEFRSWESAISSGVAQIPKRAAELITKLAREESVRGISAAAMERVRNGFLAFREGHLARVEHSQRMMNYLQQKENPRPPASDPVEQMKRPPEEVVRDPLTGEPEDLSKIAPENLASFEMLSFELEGARAYYHSINEMLRNSRSLSIAFELSDKIMTGPHKEPFRIEDYITPRDSNASLWVARLLLREGLMRRKLAVDLNGNLHTLADALEDDDIFLLAAHPEAAPIWAHLPLEEFEMRTYALGDSGDAWFFPTLVINADGDKCSFDLNRKTWRKGTGEVIGARMSITTKNEEKYDCNFIEAKDVKRITNWFQAQWQGYSAKVGVSPAPVLKVNRDRSDIDVEFSGVSASRILGFYAFLAGQH